MIHSKSSTTTLTTDGPLLYLYYIQILGERICYKYSQFKTKVLGLLKPYRGASIQCLIASATGNSNESIVLLDFLGSPFGMRTRLALAAKGVQYETVHEDLTQSKSPLLLQVNPVHKSIPVLIHNGIPICESLIIMEYIDEVWKDIGRPLLPADPLQRAKAKFWADYINRMVYPPSHNVWAAEGEKQEAAKREFVEKIKVLEGELDSKPYFGGESLGFLDIAFLPFYFWFHTYETFGRFSIEAECPKLVAWGKRCMQEEFVNAALPHPHKLYDIVADFKKKLGI